MKLPTMTIGDARVASVRLSTGQFILGAARNDLGSAATKTVVPAGTQNVLGCTTYCFGGVCKTCCPGSGCF